MVTCGDGRSFPRAESCPRAAPQSSGGTPCSSPRDTTRRLCPAAPLFLSRACTQPPTFSAHTILPWPRYAEMEKDTKNGISHRRRALDELRARLPAVVAAASK